MLFPTPRMEMQPPPALVGVLFSAATLQHGFQGTGSGFGYDKGEERRKEKLFSFQPRHETVIYVMSYEGGRATVTGYSSVEG